MADPAIYAVYREDDAAGLELRIRRVLERERKESELAVELRTAAVQPGVDLPPVPAGATVLLLVGTRWLAPTKGAVPYLDAAADPLRKLISTAFVDGVPVVPVLSGVRLDEWGPICRQLPDQLGKPLNGLNAAELRAASFVPDLRALLARLGAARAGGRWPEASARAVIEVAAGGGGPVKWYSNQGVTVRVFVDDQEVGALSGWIGRFTCAVAPGRHVVQVGEGRRSRSAPITVQAETDMTVSLVCARNVFTQKLSLVRKG